MSKYPFQLAYFTLHKTYFFYINFTGVHTYTHLSNIIEAITDNVSGGQMACQTIFNRHVGVKQADHGQLAETALTIL